MHRLIGLIVVVLLVVLTPGVLLAENLDYRVVEHLTNGTINWSDRTIRAFGSGVPLEKSSPSDLNKQERLVETATDKAHENMIDTISMLPVNTQELASDLIMGHKEIKDQIRAMVQQSKIVTKDYLTDGSVKMIIEIPFDGGFAQLLLPEDIQQIQPLKSVFMPPKPLLAVENKTVSNPEAPAPFTGIIVDTRGLTVRPVLSPKILDEKGGEVFGPAYISREYAVSHGTVLYSRSLKDPRVAKRVGDHPLIVTGLKSLGTFQADIIISSADAAKFHSNSSHLKILNHCMVAIILDGKGS